MPDTFADKPLEFRAGFRVAAALYAREGLRLAAEYLESDGQTEADILTAFAIAISETAKELAPLSTPELN
jgi:hypothetical protein